MANPLDLVAFAKRAWEEAQKPNAFRMDEVPVDRGFLAPLATYADGQTELALPAFPLGAIWDGVRSFGAKGFDTPEAIQHNAGAAFDTAGGIVQGGLGVGLAGGLADDAVKAVAKPALEDMPARAAFKWGDDVFTGQYHGNAIRAAVDKYGKDPINAAWDPDKTFGWGDLEGFKTIGGDFVTREQALDTIRASGLAKNEWLPDAELHADTLNYLRSKGLWANAPTGSSVPLAVNALERAQPQVSKNLAGRDVYDFGGGTQVTMKDWPSGGRMIDNVYTDPQARGQGQARRAMEYILAEADQAGTPLKLAVSPGDMTTDAQRLQQFYEGLGFDYLGGGYMSRDPRPRAQPQGIRAYHGSPHDFDRFSLDKIGTGEGAQAYGHGLYFAENEGVARSYRDKLAQTTVDGKPYVNNTPEGVVAQAFEFNNGDIEKVRDYLLSNQNFKGHSESIRELHKRALELVDSGYAPSVSSIGGRMYEVNIRANPEDFLDWDKPVTPELADRMAEAFTGLMGSHYDELADLLRYGHEQGMTGREAHQWIANTLEKGYVPDGVFRDVSGKYADHASQYLREAGIPGIRYLDGMSRGAGEGSSNYVVFDDQLIDILRKYANAPTGAAVPLAGETQDTDPALLEYLRAVGLY